MVEAETGAVSSRKIPNNSMSKMTIQANNPLTTLRVIFGSGTRSE
ncbi:MAG: hypothetical protein WCF07_13985 [Nitrososphaeraceae archaeon]